MAPPGRDCSRRSLRSVDGGLDDMRDVLAGRCNFSTSSINSSLLRACLKRVLSVESEAPRPL